MQHSFTQKDYFLQLISQYGGEIENVPKEIIARIQTIVIEQQLEANSNTLKQILKDLRLHKYFQDIPYILYRLTGKRDVISEEKKAALLKAFEYHSKGSDGRTNNKFNVAYYIRVELFCVGIRKLQRMYQNRCARLIQRTWDRYWYQPNGAGESRAGLTGYRKLVGLGTITSSSLY